MQLKTRQNVVTLNMDCFRHVSLFSDHVHVVWITFQMLTNTPTVLPPQLYKLFGEVMTSYATLNGELHADD